MTHSPSATTDDPDPSPAATHLRPWLRQYDANVPHHLNYPRIPLYRLLDDTAAKTPAAPCTRFFGRRMT